MITLDKIREWGFTTLNPILVDCWNSVVTSDDMFSENPALKEVYIDSAIYEKLRDTQLPGMGKRFFGYKCNVEFYPRYKTYDIDFKEETNNNYQLLLLKALREDFKECWNAEEGTWILQREAQYELLKIFRYNFRFEMNKPLSFFLKQSGLQYNYIDKNGGWADIRIFKAYKGIDLNKIKQEILSSWEERNEYSDINEIGKLTKPGLYVYGIKKDGKIIYIGETTRNLKTRWFEHICGSNGKWEVGATFIILYDGKEIRDNQQLQTLEKMLIEEFKPRRNIEGVVFPYKYQSEKMAIQHSKLKNYY